VGFLFIYLINQKTKTMNTEKKLLEIGGLVNLVEVCIANEYGIEGVLEYRKTRSAEAVKELKTKGE
jgi:hypothetical protein